MKIMVKKIGEHMENMSLEQGLFSDIVFKPDDGTQTAHKPLLMVR